MERFINILVIDSDQTNRNGLEVILNAAGNNLIFANNEDEAFPILKKRKVGIILLNIEHKGVDGIGLLQRLKQNKHSTQAYKIVICDNTSSGAHLVKGLREGAVDFITKPFNPNLVKAKIEVFKSLYFKDRRINQLLTNIFPQNVLNDLNTVGKFSPKRIEEGVVIFTDFVAFSKVAKNKKPLLLLKQLEEYFNKFDEIIDRYALEKIKTMGDAYMALSGVTEKNPKPAVRACLAALEMRDYMISLKNYSKARNEEFWEIRIGIHSGPLVAGIIGSKKMSFDVWGDTVNTAARAEQNSEPNSITITERIAGHILPYFLISQRGAIAIKHGGKMDMYFLDRIKPNYSLFDEGKLPNSTLRKRCQLSTMDFDHARKSILNKLIAALPSYLVYHNTKHTLNVEKAAARIAKLEGIDGDELILLKTAVLFHDAGFITSNDNNEGEGIRIMKSELPKYGYNKQQVEIIANIIRSTKKDATPTTLLEKIMCDADHDYLGRADYTNIATKLREELSVQGKDMTDQEWVEFQLNYLENEHQYYTQTARSIRLRGKEKRIYELKKELNALKPQ